MGTDRSTSAKKAVAPPRKRTPKKATSKPAEAPTVIELPAITLVAEPPVPATGDPVAERVEKLRQMLVAEGLDPDVVLAGMGAETTTPPAPAPVTAGAEDIDVALGYSPDFEPIPGVDLGMLRNIIEEARGNPTTADVVISGLRNLIEENGHNPDTIIADAFAETVDVTQPNGMVNSFVGFRGHQIEVMAPEIEQVMVIRRMQSLFANAAKMQNITADEAVRLMDRALMAVCSVVVKPEDVEFLEDLLLTRQAKIEDLLPLLRESLQTLERANGGNNREERRKAARSSGSSGRAALATAGE
jgi:hypothetical protein